MKAKIQPTKSATPPKKTEEGPRYSVSAATLQMILDYLQKGKTSLDNALIQALQADARKIETGPTEDGGE